MLRNPACYTIHLVTNPTILPTQICNITNHVTHPIMLPTPTCFSHHRINAFLPCYQPKILHNPSSTQMCYQFKPVTKVTMSFIPLCLQSHCAIFTTLLPTSHCVTHSISICYQQHHVTSSPQYCSTHHVTHSNMLLNLHVTHTMMSPTST